MVDEGTVDAPSHWFVQNGILNQNSNIYGGDASALPAPGTYALTGQDTWSNSTAAVNMKSTDDGGIGLMFGYKDSNNYYRFSMDRQQSHRRLVKVVNGAFRTGRRLRGLRSEPVAHRGGNDVERQDQGRL